MSFKLIINPFTGCVVPVPVSPGNFVALYHETDENGDSQPIATEPTVPFPSDVDSNGDLELVASIVYPTINDPYYEPDGNGDIQHRVGF